MVSASLHCCFSNHIRDIGKAGSKNLAVPAPDHFLDRIRELHDKLTQCCLRWDAAYSKNLAEKPIISIILNCLVCRLAKCIQCDHAEDDAPIARDSFPVPDTRDGIDFFSEVRGLEKVADRKQIGMIGQVRGGGFDDNFHNQSGEIIVDTKCCLYP
jgi:hypothetical protein